MPPESMIEETDPVTGMKNLTLSQVHIEQTVTNICFLKKIQLKGVSTATIALGLTSFKMLNEGRTLCIAFQCSKKNSCNFNDILATGIIVICSKIMYVLHTVSKRERNNLNRIICY